MEYGKRYVDKAVFLRDVEMWVDDAVTGLDIFLKHVEPKGEEGEINYEILKDFRNDLQKDLSSLVRNAIADALHNTVKCQACDEPKEWCAANTPYCEGNDEKIHSNKQM